MTFKNYFKRPNDSSGMVKCDNKGFFFFASPLWKATEEWSRGDIFVKGDRLRIQEGQPFWEAVRIDLTAKSLQRVSLVGFASGSGVKNLPAMQETWAWSLGQEDCPGGENSNPLQYSYLENPTDKEASQAPWGHKESDMTERLHTHISFVIFLCHWPEF